MGIHPRRAGAALVAAAVLATTAGACGALGTPGGSSPTPASPAPPATTATASPATSPGSPAPGTGQQGPPVTPPAGALAMEQAYSQVIRTVLPSIVQITTRTGLGSGIIYDTQGHIITNAHVIGDEDAFEVTPATGGSPRRARLVESFPAGDLAVIKVDDPSRLPPARFGDSSKVQVGQAVLAMGNPLGLSGSVTNGIVSAIGRTVSEPQERGSPGATIPNAIQTSAAINPGNSGGALVNLSGEVIGIPTLAATDPAYGGGAAPGIGFAIPSNTATDIAGQIVRTGKVTNTHRAALGISAGVAIGPDGRPEGVNVVSVTPNGGAAKAGIRPGDVIVSVNGVRTPTTVALAEVLAGLKPGDRAKVEIVRADGSEATVTVTLGELPSGE